MGLLQSASRTVLSIDVFIFLLLGFSFIYLKPGSESYVVAQVTLIPIVLTFIACIALIYTGWDPFE